MTATCVLQPAMVTEDLRRAAQEKTEELFVALVSAKNEWQYAVKNQDEAYQRVLQLKAEYAEWRAMTERLTEILRGPRAAGLGQEAPCLSAGAARLFSTLAGKAATGTR